VIEVILRYDTWADWRKRRRVHYRYHRRLGTPRFYVTDAFGFGERTNWVLERTGCL
jgi:hypothetical protein